LRTKQEIEQVLADLYEAVSQLDGEPSILDGEIMALEWVLKRDNDVLVEAFGKLHILLVEKGQSV
jgi:hypothetical protein